MQTPPFMITYSRLKVVNRLTAACVLTSPLVAYVFGMSWGLLFATLAIWQFLQVMGLVVGVSVVLVGGDQWVDVHCTFALGVGTLSFYGPELHASC